MKEAILWLCRSHKEGPDEGSSCFRVITGWSAGYPEVTGYNLYTLLKYHVRTGDEISYKYAIRMANWLLTVQQGTGAYQGGYIDQEPKPIAFNTAQVLHGLVRSYEITNNETYLDSAIRAANWLLSVQDKDGAWRKCVYLGEFRVTDSRIAYPLLQIWKVTNEKHYREAAEASLRYIKILQKKNGWFPLCDNSLTYVDQPVTHTLAYTCEGLLKSGLILKNNSIIQTAQKTADVLLHRFEMDKLLYGRYNSQWRPTVKWTCLTGCAQISEIWSLFYSHTNNVRYLNAALRMNDYLCACQDIEDKNPAMRGGISGSEPIYGNYQPRSFPSWATKYFIDALMAEERALERSRLTTNPSTHSILEQNEP